ncbi:diacylglycerol kinase family protein [Carnobacteriaceae bacterium zg-ZUI78]|nr:diacylglycerol kinase family protein [Carnobacteriaceae bacterium zg-ZUI78]
MGVHKQTTKNKHFLQSLCHALHGVKTAFKEEKNMQKHVITACFVITLGFLLQCNISEWLWLIHCIVLVLILELLNTVAETLVDVLTEGKYYEWAKKVKDVAAGAVLIASVYAAIVGIMIFLPKLFT